MTEYEIELTGTRPLMINNPLAGKLELKEPDEQRAREQAEKRLYKNKAEKPVLPAIHIEGSLIQASKEVKASGKGNKKMTKYVATQVRVSPELIPIEGDWETDVRLCKVPSTGGQILVARPVFQEWKVAFKVLVVNDTLVPETALKTILELAGAVYGVGTYRLKFGQFEVTKFNKIVATKKA